MKKRLFIPLVTFIFFGAFHSKAQLKLTSNEASYSKQFIDIEKSGTINPKSLSPTFNPRIQHLEAPAPDGDSYRAALLRFKKDAGKVHPRNNAGRKSAGDTIPKPVLLDGFGMQRLAKYPVNGELKDTLIYVSGGIPLDNTLAISNDNYLLAGINSYLYFRDLRNGYEPTDSNIFVVSFSDFAAGLNPDGPFDPKVLYDPEYDRFIATFLTGRTPANSGIILAFSTSNDPTDPWNTYRIPGNPLQNNTWTDYPAMAMTEDELFLTVNLLIPGVDWKIGFSETIIWHFDKESGYNGEENIRTALWSGIELDGRNLRNLAPIQGGDSLHGPNMFFLSNRNFDLENDSIFIVEVTGKLDDPDAKMNIGVVKADAAYGLPPNGRQENSDPNDPSDGFDTNDSRVLGSFIVDDDVQFVGNTMDFETGNAAVFHGFIKNISTNPTVSAKVIGHNQLDFGYPNIVYTGTSECPSASLIAFDHTSPFDYAGISAIKFKGGIYSDLMTLKDGEGYVDSWLAGSYERWGDYFGIQRKYNEPGVVWTAGFFGRANRSSGTWISELRDCSCFSASVSEQRTSDINSCLGYLETSVLQGITPYSFTWNGLSSSANKISVNLCDYAYTLSISDSKSCDIQLTGEKTQKLPVKGSVIYPNPSFGEVNVFFELSESGFIEVSIYGIDGKLVKRVVDSNSANAGRNLLTFSTNPLSSGTYILKIISADQEVFTGKMLVQ
ncbi:MAG: T9SS type A sorting domain-containing protein [Vicingaceae bacterium]